MYYVLVVDLGVNWREREESVSKIDKNKHKKNTISEVTHDIYNII